MREKKINSVLQQFCICVGFLQIPLAAENPAMIEDAFFVVVNNILYITMFVIIFR